MKNRAWLILVFCGVLSSSLAAQQFRVNGYFSLDYLKGQSQSFFSQGSYQNARAGLIFSGEWTPQFSYALEIQSKDEMRFEIEQAWAGFFWSDTIHVKLGLYLVPFGKYNVSSRAFQTRSIQPPFPLNDVFPASWRDIGLLVEGKTGIFIYSAYLGNGLTEGENLRAGQQFKDNNHDKGRGSRLGFLVSQNIEVGLSYYSCKIDDEDKRGLSLKGVDLTWFDETYTLSGEYVRADIENPEPFSKGTAEGWFLIGSFSLGSISPFVAFEKYRYEDPFHGAGYAGPLAAGLGIFENRSRWAAGLVATIHPNFLVKLEYDFNKQQNLVLKDNVFLVQAAVHF